LTIVRIAAAVVRRRQIISTPAFQVTAQNIILFDVKNSNTIAERIEQFKKIKTQFKLYGFACK
jgi:hypothetical protein